MLSSSLLIFAGTGDEDYLLSHCTKSQKLASKQCKRNCVQIVVEVTDITVNLLVSYSNFTNVTTQLNCEIILPAGPRAV